MENLLCLHNEDTIGVIIEYLTLNEILNLSLISKDNLLTKTSENHFILKKKIQQLKFLYKITFFEKDYKISERNKIIIFY